MATEGEMELALAGALWDAIVRYATEVPDDLSEEDKIGLPEEQDVILETMVAWKDLDPVQRLDFISHIHQDGGVVDHLTVAVAMSCDLESAGA
jgi:hypothetical protein